MADTTTKGFPYPEGPDLVDVAGDIQLLAEAVDDMPGIQSYTSTEIAGLAVGEKWAGRVIWNSTAGELQVSNGSTFSSVSSSIALSSATPQALGVAAAGTSGDASRADHVHAMPSASSVGAVANSTVDAAGDLLVGSADNTVGRLALGANGAVLTVDTAGSGVNKVKWAAVPAPISPLLLMGA